MTATTFLERINQDLKDAMKQSKTEVTQTLRLLMSGIKNEKINKQRDLTDEEIVAVVSREVKKRRDSILAFEQASRSDLVEKEKAEMIILQAYMPAQLSEEEVMTQVKAVVAEMPGAPFGKIMGAAMAKLKGQVDGNLVQKIVKEALG